MNFKNIFKVAGLIALITILSKFVGFIRDIVIAHSYGASVASDAYFAAYQIPAITLILLGGLGGPFHTVTVSIFSKGADKNGADFEDRQRALNTFINLTCLGFLVITAVIFFGADWISTLIAGGGTTELHKMMADQLRIMSPILFIGGIVGILFGISNVYNKFLMTAISPAMTSLTVIIALLFTKGDKAGLILAWTTLAGATLQVLLQLPPYFQAGFKYRFDMDIKNERVKKIGEIIFPALLSCTIGQINIYIDMLFAFRLTEGSWTAIGYANRFFQFPVGVVITPMLVSIFPTFSKFVGEKNWEELRVYFQRSINSLWFVSFPIFVTLAMFSMEGTKIVLQRGKFDAHDTFMVTEALFYLSFAILFYVVRDTLTRIYYAFDDAKTPFLTALIAVGLKALLNALLVGPFGIGGITLSTGIMSGINGLLLAYFVRKKISLEFLKLLHSLKKLVMSSLIMAGVLFCSKTLFYHYLGDGRIALILNISISLALGCTAYFISAIFLKIEAAELIFDKTRIKIKSYYRRDNIEEKI